MLGLVPLLNAGRVKRGGPGRPKSRPKQLVGDRGYSNGVTRTELRRREIRAVIPPKRDQRRQNGYDREVYRERNRVERAIVKLKRFRRVATRYDKRQEHFLALVTLAVALEWV